MPTTVLVTRDVADRYHGFVASVMPEVAPGVYIAPELSHGVRKRLWAVLENWWLARPGGSIVLCWKEDNAPGRLGIESLGLPVRKLADFDGVLSLL